MSPCTAKYRLNRGPFKPDYVIPDVSFNRPQPPLPQEPIACVSSLEVLPSPPKGRTCHFLPNRSLLFWVTPPRPSDWPDTSDSIPSIVHRGLVAAGPVQSRETVSRQSESLGTASCRKKRKWVAGDARGTRAKQVYGIPSFVGICFYFILLFERTFLELSYALPEIGSFRRCKWRMHKTHTRQIAMHRGYSFTSKHRDL